VYEALKLAILTLVLPPGGPLLLLAFGVLLLRRRPRTGRAMVIAGTAALWLLSLPVVVGALVTVLAGGRTLQASEALSADAIVILGGGTRPRAKEFGGDTLGRLTLERVRYGAVVARRTGLPVLVTGGSLESGVRPEADLMREALEAEFGVNVRWSDDQARDTGENALNSARILIPEDKRRIVLVMHGFDVRRAVRQFEAAGFNVLAAPTQIPSWGRPGIVDFLPSVGALYTSYYALYEALALTRDTLTP